MAVTSFHSHQYTHISYLLTFRPRPVLLIDDFFQTRPHTRRDRLVAPFPTFVAFGTILNNGLDGAVEGRILVFEIFQQDAGKNQEPFLLFFHFPFHGGPVHGGRGSSKRRA